MDRKKYCLRSRNSEVYEKVFDTKEEAEKEMEKEITRGLLILLQWITLFAKTKTQELVYML